VQESSGSPLKSVAEKILSDRLEEVRRGLYCESIPRKTSFSTLADDLLQDYRINRRRSTRDTEIRIKLHLGYFQNRLASAITTDMVKEYILHRRAEGATDGTIHNECTILKRMFNLAFRAGKIARVPYIPVPRSANVRKGFLERDGYEPLMAALPIYWKPLVQMAYCTGMRKGELLSLRWENVDLPNRLVRLNAGETKNGEARVVPVGDDLANALRAQLQLRDTQFPDCPLVFFRVVKTKRNPVPSWRPIVDIRKSFETASKKVGLPGLIFHDLRRSAIRNIVRAGVHERVAMRISGHKTRSVFDRYNIVSEADLVDAVRKLQKFHEAPPAPVVQPVQIPSASTASAAQPRFLN